MFRAQIRPEVDLRLIEDRHADAVFGLVDRERERLRVWLPWVDATKAVDDTRSFIEHSLKQYADNAGFAAGIWVGKKFAGVIGTSKIDWLNERVEIGYWIGSEFEGKGIVTDSCRALVTHAFEDLNLHRVEIHCSTQNARSCSIPRKLGFTCEATLRDALRLYGHFHDRYVFAMLKGDWKG